jgi:hypothetical protein
MTRKKKLLEEAYLSPSHLWEENGNMEKVKKLWLEGKKAREISSLLSLNQNSVRSAIGRFSALEL